MRPTARRRWGSAEQYSSSHSFTAWQSAADSSPLMSPLTVSAIWVPKSTATSMPSVSMSFKRWTGSIMPGRPLRALSVNGPVTLGPGPWAVPQIRPSRRIRG
jgi:hypothetical protein